MISFGYFSREEIFLVVNHTQCKECSYVHGTGSVSPDTCFNRLGNDEVKLRSEHPEGDLGRWGG